MLGERLKTALAIRNMTQKELSQKIGITDVTMSRYCKNERKPTSDVIIKICKTLNISADWLMELQEKSMEQMSIVDYLLDQTYDRNGSQNPAPPWMDRERCENCRYWSIYPVEEQPPAGWSVVGQCNKSHEPEMMRNGYWKVSKTSYCQEYEVIK